MMAKKGKKSGADTLRDAAAELVENFEIGGIPGNTIKNFNVSGIPGITIDKFAENITETGSGLVSRKEKKDQ